MSKASSLYRCLSKTNFSAAELLNILNSEICETTSRGMFVTMLIGIYDSNKKELLLANAGHEPPLIYSNDGNFSNFEEAGPPLGIAPKFKFKETKINFSNSSMYIFTDGITEIKDTKGNMLESDGFQNYIKKYQAVPNNERLNKIIEDIIKSGRIQKDESHYCCCWWKMIGVSKVMIILGIVLTTYLVLGLTSNVCRYNFD